MQRPKFLKCQFRKIQGEARKAAKVHGDEVCGLILDNGLFCELVQLRNKTKRGGGFSFYFGEVRAIEKWAGLCEHKIVGIFHSHPVGLAKPGSSDLCCAVHDDMMLIFDVIGESAKLWHVEHRKARELSFRLV